MKQSADLSPKSPSPSSPHSPAQLKAGTASSDPLDEAVLKLATQAAFLQGFAERLAEVEQPVEERLPSKVREEDDYGWRAGLNW